MFTYFRAFIVYAAVTIAAFLGSYQLGVSQTQLSDFEVLKRDGAVNILWTMASEENVDRYIIERSNDGESWSYLTEVPSIGMAGIEMEYFEMDNGPFDNHEIHYRLVIVDQNGKKSNAMKAVACINNVELDPMEFLVFPNPVNRGGTVTIANPDFQFSELTLVLQSIGGEEFYTKLVRTDAGGLYEVMELNENIPSGRYSIKGSSEELLFNRMLIIR